MKEYYRNAEVVWNKNIESQNKEEIQKFLTPYLWMIPTWVHKITITLAESEGNLAGMRTRFQYREVDLDICPEWFIRTDEVKADAILHELCHMHNYQIFDFADRLIDKFIEDEKTKEVLSDELTRYLEGGTQDLTRAILSKFNE